MEITLPGFELYNIPAWDGKVEVEALRKYQYSRIAGSYSETALYRKILKVFTGKDTPVQFPKDFDPNKLDFAHFLQIMTAVVACHERHISEIITCNTCKAKNPKVIDIIKSTVVTAPKNPAEKTTFEHEGKTIECNRMTIGKYLELQTYIDNLFMGRPEEVRIRVREEYAKDFTLEDDEDILDLKQQLDDIGSLAILTEYAGMGFKELFIWLAQLQGKDGTELYDKIDTATADMSATLESIFKDTCVVCGKELEKEVSPVGYFFGTRQQ